MSHSSLLEIDALKGLQLKCLMIFGAGPKMRTGPRTNFLVDTCPRAS